MERAIFSVQCTCDKAVGTLLRAIYFVGKKSLRCTKFPALCKLLLSVKASMTNNIYQDEKACIDFVMCISIVI